MASLAQRQTSSDHLRELTETGFMLRRHILSLVLVVLALALAGAVTAKPGYVAESELIVLPSEDYTFHAVAGSNALANEAMSNDAIIGAEVAILKSPALARVTIAQIGLKTLYPSLTRKPGLIARLKQRLHGLINPHAGQGASPDPIALALPVFAAHLVVVAGTNDDVLTVKFSHPDAAVARLVVNTLETLYLARRRTLFADDQSGPVAEQVAVDRAILDHAEDSLNAFQSRHNVTQFKTRESILLEQQGRMEQDLITSRSAAAEMTVELDILHRQHGMIAPNIRLQQSINSDERTVTLRTGLDALRTQLASALNNYRADSPQVEDVKAKIAKEAALLKHETANDAPSTLQTGQNPVYADINLDLVRDTTALASAQVRTAQDRAALSQVAAELRQLDGLKARLAALERQRQVAAGNYAEASKTLGDRELVEQVEAEKRANVRVLYPAMLPLYPYPTRKLIMLVGMIAGGAGAVMLVLLANLFRRGALLATVFETESGIPLLGVIPELSLPQASQLRIGR